MKIFRFLNKFRANGIPTLESTTDEGLYVSFQAFERDQILEAFRYRDRNRRPRHQPNVSNKCPLVTIKTKNRPARTRSPAAAPRRPERCPSCHYYWRKTRTSCAPFPMALQALLEHSDNKVDGSKPARAASRLQPCRRKTPALPPPPATPSVSSLEQGPAPTAVALVIFDGTPGYPLLPERPCIITDGQGCAWSPPTATVWRSAGAAPQLVEKAKSSRRARPCWNCAKL